MQKKRLQSNIDPYKTNTMDYIKRYYLDNPHISHSIEPKEKMPFNDWIEYIYAEVRGSKVSDEPTNRGENMQSNEPLNEKEQEERQRGGGVEKSRV